MPDTQLLSGIKVLLVDDDPDILGAFEWSLKFAGAEVKACLSGQEAIKVCGSWSPDVLVSDLTMPIMNGYVLLATLRLLDNCRDIPAIALSGLTDLNKALEHGFTTAIRKPIYPDDLIELISKILLIHE